MSVKRAFENGKAFIPFITCGDPDIETTEKIIDSLIKGGADLIQLGIPFSDPTAEGPIIESANVRALKNGITTDDIFNMIRRIRITTDVPLVFMTYANVVFSYGTNRFLEAASNAGIDGLILPDVPFEEKEDFAEECEKNGIDFISLIAPASNNRIEMIASQAKGFVYCIPAFDESEAENNITNDINSMIDIIKNSTDIPCAVNAENSTPKQAAQIAEKSDGIIISSEIVKIIAEFGKNAPEKVYEYSKLIKEAIK